MHLNPPNKKQKTDDVVVHVHHQEFHIDNAKIIVVSPKESDIAAAAADSVGEDQLNGDGDELSQRLRRWGDSVDEGQPVEIQVKTEVEETRQDFVKRVNSGTVKAEVVKVAGRVEEVAAGVEVRVKQEVLEEDTYTQTEIIHCGSGYIKKVSTLIFAAKRSSWITQIISGAASDRAAWAICVCF